MTIKLFGKLTLLSIETEDRCTCGFYDEFDAAPQDDREPDDPEDYDENEPSWIDCYHCGERLVTIQGVLPDEDLSEMLAIHATVCPARNPQENP